MIKRAADKTAGYMSQKGIVPSDVEEVLSYGFECLLASAVQLAFLLILGLVFRLTGPLTAFLLGFAAIKRWVGGYHAKSHFACVLQFTLMALAGSAGSAMVSAVASHRWQNSLLAALLLSAVVLVFWKAPDVHPNRPKTNEERKTLAKRSRVTVSALSLLLLSLAAFAQAEAGSLALSCGTGCFCAAATLIKLKKSRGKEEIKP